MQPKKFFRLYQTVIVFTAISIFSIVGVLFGVVPLVQKTVDVQKQVGTLGAEVAMLRTKSDTLAGLDEEALRTDLLTLSSAVPPEKAIATVMTTLDGVSGQTGVALIDFSLSKPGSLATESAKKLTVDEAKIGSHLLPFSVTVRGDLIQIRAFLSTVGAVRRLFRVNSFNVSVTGAGAEARVDMIAFYTPYPAAVGSLIQPITVLSDRDREAITAVSALPLLAGEPVSAVENASQSARGGKSDPFTP